MGSILTLFGPGVIVGLSLLGSVGLSQPGLAKNLREMPSLQLIENSKTYKHTREVCYVYIQTSKETYCKTLEDWEVIIKNKIVNYLIDSFIVALIGESFSDFEATFEDGLNKVENGLFEEEG